MMRDTRGATSPISYALSIAIATILITGLVISAFGHVSDQRTRTAQTQMDVVGQQVAGSLEAADRLVRADESENPNTLELERNLPRQIQNSGYQIEITYDPDPTIANEVIVSSPFADQDVIVAYHSDTEVVESTVQGGQIEISWNHPDLEVQNG